MPMLICRACKSYAGKAIKYVSDEKKAELLKLNALDESRSLAQQFIDTAHLHGKGDNFDERKYYHIKVSFEEKDLIENGGKLTPETAEKITEDFLQKNYSGYEYVLAVHTDAKHLHAHAIINAVSFETGKKIQHSNYDLMHMKDEINDISARYGVSRFDWKEAVRQRRKEENKFVPVNSKELSIEETYIKERSGKNFSKYSWKESLRDCIDDAKAVCKDRNEFQKYLQEKYNITMPRNTAKTVSFVHPNAGISVRGMKLGADYTSEAIDQALNMNLEKYTEQQDDQTDRSVVNSVRIIKVNTIPSSYYDQMKILARNVECDEKALKFCLNTIIDERIEGYSSINYKIDNLTSINKSNNSLRKSLERKNEVYIKAYNALKTYNKYLPVYQMLQNKLFKQGYLKAHESELKVFHASEDQLKELGYKPDTHIDYMERLITENTDRITETESFIEKYDSEVSALKKAKAFIDDITSKVEFAEEQDHEQEQQADVRNALWLEANEKAAQLVKDIENGACESSRVENLIIKLHKQLEIVSGKKVYGYLPKETKMTIDEIVRELAADERIAELYNIWCKLDKDNYTDEIPDDVPLENETEFASIKNTIIKATLEQSDPSLSVTNTALDLFTNLSRIITDNIDLQNNKNDIDKKLYADIAKKKAALGEKSDYGFTMEM